MNLEEVERRLRCFGATYPEQIKLADAIKAHLERCVDAVVLAGVVHVIAARREAAEREMRKMNHACYSAGERDAYGAVHAMLQPLLAPHHCGWNRSLLALLREAEKEAGR